MKWRFHHKARKAFLTTAICLALSQSVFAMPTGGKVIEGDITGITNGTIASGGTINVAGSGLIDWNAFGIGAGETLNYAFTSPGTLINHVTGADMSQLLGTLNSTGAGNLWLINPNGIVVGSSAQLNAGSLVLSTLNATDEALKGFLHGGDLTLTSADATKGIEVQSGAKITAGNALNLVGGHIKIADNVTVSASGDSFNMSAVAAKQAGFEGGKTEDGVSSGTAGVGNTLTLGNVTFDIKSPESDVYFIGHDVSLDGTKLNLTSKDASKSSASLDVIAANQFGYEPIAGQDDENGWKNFDIGNTLDVKGASLTADYMRLAGGKTTVDGSALTLTKTTDTVKEGYTMPYLMVSALNGKRVIFDDVAGDVGGTENTAGATLTVKDSKLNSQENIALLGGAVSVTNSQLTTAAENDDKDNNIDINAYSTGDHATPSNAVTVTGGSLVSGGDISVQGGKITFDGVKAADDKGIFLATGNRFSFPENSDDTNIEEASDANAILVKNTKMSTNDAMALIGGKVDVTNGSNLTAGDLEIVAGSSCKNEGNTIAGTDTTNLTISDATLHSNEDTTLVGSNIKFANTKLEVGTPTDYEYGSNGVVRIAAAKNVTLTDDNTDGFVIGSVNQTGNLTMDKVTLSAQGNVMAYGKIVKIKDSNLSTTKDNDIDIGAFKSGLTADTFNTVKVTGGSIVSGGDINIQGASVALDGVKDVKSADDIFLMASKQFTFTDNDDEGCLSNNTDANALSVKNTTMRANDAMTLVGGKVDVTDGSNLTARVLEKNTPMHAMTLIGGKVDVTNGSNLTARDLEIVAGSSYKNEGNTIAGTDTTNLTISDSTLHANEDATLVGANIKLANTKLEVGTPTDHTYGSNGVVRIAAAKNVTLTDDNTNGFAIGSVNQTGNLTMDKVNLSAYGTVMAYGKTVKLQDSVLSTTNDEDLVINAVNTYKRVNGSSDSWTATPDNTIEVSGSTLTDQGNIELSGGKVTVEKSSLTATGDDGFVDVNARASYTDADDGPYVNKAVAGMDVNVKDTKLSGDDGVGVFGHTVTVDGDSSLTSKAGKVFLAAGKTVEMTDDSLKGDGAPVNIGKNVKYDASKTLFEPDKKLIETTKPSDPGTKPSDPGTNPSKPPVVTPDPQPAADIAKNIAQGQADMAKALQENPQQAAAAVQQQAEKLSRSTMTETEKVAQLKGYVEAIQATQESAETKNDLLVTVVKSFEPTQQEGITAQTKQDEAAQTKTAKAAVNAAAVSQPTVVPADQTPLVTVDSTAVKD
ncbi:filamentous hemagglutinin N-terminal domain-containing protein [Selenomonas bovis]|uniref:filamentous hemagglutinin N-terminal domain-containing protein n=1 Tax=Selenomonas bovis TaxID=416586 RepID=UPI0004E126F0|nr:filamentous hemagglutinin N-terminal domain-containing protein [Selenomonas bovis]